MLHSLFEGQKIVIANDNEVLAQNHINHSFGKALNKAVLALIGAEAYVVNGYLCFWRDLHMPVNVKGLALEQERVDFYVANKEAVDEYTVCNSLQDAKDLMGDAWCYLPKDLKKYIAPNTMAEIWFNADVNHRYYKHVIGAVVANTIFESGKNFGMSFDLPASKELYQSYLVNVDSMFDRHSNKSMVLNYLQHNHDAKSELMQSLIGHIGIDNFVQDSMYFYDEHNKFRGDSLSVLNTATARVSFYEENTDVIHVWLKAEAAIRGGCPLDFMRYPVPYSPISVTGDKEDKSAVLIDNNKNHSQYLTIVDSFMLVMLGVISKDFLEYSCYEMSLEEPNTEAVAKAAFDKGYEQAKADILAHMQKIAA